MASSKSNAGKSEAVQAEVVEKGPNGLDMTGFVKSIDQSEEWGKLSIDRRMYKPDACAQYGGVQGYLLKVEEMQSDIAKSEKNPEGIFQALIVRLTAPAPIVDDKGNLSRAEPGEDVIVVVTDRLKRLTELDSDPDFCVELAILPKEKIKLDSKRQLWRYDVGARLRKIPRSEVSADTLVFQNVSADKLLASGQPNGQSAAQAQSAAAS